MWETFTLIVNVPFKLDNSTAEIMAADNSRLGYKDPVEIPSPGRYVGESFFLTIYDARGNEV